ncbi:N-6 DNA methylase [Mesorhizobium sp.]|uniref:Eco57I restriction-modification methylase domain-containing protein n=1 Tax=Mesorhizobium sp. TaxID=1871066 RepID=UPI000FE67075|nr:N-6 DNA methylase [Mesorhizobium sp.]RWN51502.1 MAG: type II DNA modification enzyme [Mesorhizobium sp.]RWN72177.1 MAG: type II DNA modification enzyme [Mesorhizobium sp.]RWN73398.1 MAG: type II DNA modification enzyme [Mesorhizobium sp.]RWO09439.1 MAG: type II DNA modification enzyme [Mesorhizobium sp.]RWO64480.1 MAG: type II DNA modification enzyme [Mesorhizobium sp.]
MARKITRTHQSRRAARQEFAAIEVVGALLTPDMLGRIAAFDANDQSEDGYGIPAGLKLRDEIARYYRIGEALWSRFVVARSHSVGASERFVLELLRQCFGFDTIKPQATTLIGEREFPVRHSALNGRVPIVIAPAPVDGARRSGLEESLVQLGDGSRRRSATLLLQEYLNSMEDACWGLASDGVSLRLLRDNISLTRPAWIEANFAKIFSEGLFSDFSVLWMLIHQSRFGNNQTAVVDCSLERWRDRGRIEGVAARNKLRQGVEAALLEFGKGFVENPQNDLLRQALREGSLTRQSFFEELLRLVYRLIFLFAAEDRELLHTPDATREAKRFYVEGYSLGRLRERCMRRVAWDRHVDAWEGLKVTFAALSRGEARLGLPALGGLFAGGVIANLDGARIENRRLLAAVWRLAWLRPEGQPLTRVNWRDMETEELGSVYESLLELTPLASADARTFEFAEGDETKGNARKISGSYYTPDPLVKLLLDSTLDPILDAAEARGGDDPAGEILKLSIIDPACGSGHFLLGAARRAAARIAKLRSPGAPSQTEFQHALREVVSHCIYGVDRNPLAVELCKVALWIEALEPGKPLTFLNAQIRCGDSLIGVFDRSMLERGIPDEAYKPLTGDDKEMAKTYARYNKQQRDGKGASGFLAELRPPASLTRADRRLAEMPQETLEQVSEKTRSFEDIRKQDEWVRLKSASDLYVSAYLYTAAFFSPKPAPRTVPGFDDSEMPLTDHVWKAAGGNAVPLNLLEGAKRTSDAVAAFHWHIEFPRVFDAGGFDVVIGNPPWERIKLQEQEFFATRSPMIATAGNKAERAKLIKALEKAELDSPDGRLWTEFQFAKRTAEAASEFVRSSGRYPLTAKGDVNTYALFAEHFAKLTKPEGRAGVIIPTGIATDSSTSSFFGDLISRQFIRKLYSFYEIRRWFRATDDRKAFCILCMGQGNTPAEFCFDIDTIDDLKNSERRFDLTAAEIARINPNTLTAPVFRSRADAELTAKIYAGVPVLIEERSQEDGGVVNPWGIRFQTMFHMSGASGLFRTQEQLEAESWTHQGTDWLRETDNGFERRVPLFEAKMIHHFDHRWATFDTGSSNDDDGARDSVLLEKQNPAFEPSPRYWVPESEMTMRASCVPASLKRAVREGSVERILKSLAEWLVGFFACEGRVMREGDLTRILKGNYPWRSVLGTSPDRFLLDSKTRATGAIMQRETPLVAGDIDLLIAESGDPVNLANSLIEQKQPRWLMGWRRNARTTDERTLIASVLPKVGVGDSVFLWTCADVSAQHAAAFVGLFSSLVADFAARQKIGGTNLSFYFIEQFPVPPPSTFLPSDLAFIVPRVLELSYTSHAMRLWAEDLGYSGAPYAWDEVRRAALRAELNAFFARKYGLSRDELRYVLDPTDPKGQDYPSETFRVLKNKEQARYHEYRTGKLVLAAWDRLAATNIGTTPVEVRAQTVAPSMLRDGAWARPLPAGHGDAGAMLAAILKAMNGPLPARQVRLAAILGLEPRLLLPHLNASQAVEWQRLVGTEASPLTGNVSSFAPRVDRNWGAGVIAHRGNGRLVEDPAVGTWAPGPGLDAIDTAGWPDGRAGLVMGVLAQISTDTVVSGMPEEIRGWVDAAAA